MLIIITTRSKNPKTGFFEILASHGVYEDDGMEVVVPWVSPESLGAKFCQTRGEWVLPDTRGR